MSRSLNIAFLMDPLETLDLKGDTTFALALEAQKRKHFINFSIDVVNDKAYISGVASNELEMNLVKSHASSARFVKEVYNYIILNKDTR